MVHVRPCDGRRRTLSSASFFLFALISSFFFLQWHGNMGRWPRVGEVRASVQNAMAGAPPLLLLGRYGRISLGRHITHRAGCPTALARMQLPGAVRTS